MLYNTTIQDHHTTIQKPFKLIIKFFLLPSG